MASSIAPSPTANTVSAIPAHSGSRPSATATNNGTSATRTPWTAQPVARPEVRAARYTGERSARAIVSGSTVGSGGADPDAGRAGQQAPDDGGRDHEGDRVDHERRAQVDRDQHAAERGPADPAEQERAGEQAADLAAAALRGQPEDQRERRDGEHRRPDAAEPAEHQQLGVARGQRARPGRGGDDEQPGEVHRALPDAGDEPARDRREQQPQHRQGADDGGGGGDPDAEAAREHRQGGRDDAVARGDEEAAREQRPDLPGQALAGLTTGGTVVARGHRRPPRRRGAGTIRPRVATLRPLSRRGRAGGGSAVGDAGPSRPVSDPPRGPARSAPSSWSRRHGRGGGVRRRAGARRDGGAARRRRLRRGRVGSWSAASRGRRRWVAVGCFRSAGSWSAASSSAWWSSAGVVVGRVVVGRVVGGTVVDRVVVGGSSDPVGPVGSVRVGVAGGGPPGDATRTWGRPSRCSAPAGSAARRDATPTTVSSDPPVDPDLPPSARRRRPGTTPRRPGAARAARARPRTERTRRSPPATPGARSATRPPR